MRPEEPTVLKLGNGSTITFVDYGGEPFKGGDFSLTYMDWEEDLDED